LACTLLLLAGANTAFAHPPADPSAPLSTAAVSVDPWLLIPLALSLASYVLGLRRLWRSGMGHGVKPLQAAAFLCGWLLLVASLVWPLDAMADKSLAAHMSQHMLLMAAAPPLLLLGMPGATWLAALPAAAARSAMRPVRWGTEGVFWRNLASPTAAMLLQGAVMWGWHLPVAMEAALRSYPLHIAMHLSFLFAGLLFWMALLRSVREPAKGAGGGLIAIVGTMMQMGLLGALLTFAETPRYPYYLEHSPAMGLTALEDQQLAGLIMWVPGAVPYLIGGLLLSAAWLSRTQRQLRHSHR
jgi:putative membrane protein